MNVDKPSTHSPEWAVESLDKIKMEIGNEVSVRLVSEHFHHGIHRILEFVNGYPQSVYSDNTQDLTRILFEDVVNTKALSSIDDEYVNTNRYTMETTMGCIGLGSEFDIFSIKRGDGGDVHMIGTSVNAVPFLMSVVGDYSLGTYVSAKMAERGEMSIGTSGYQEVDSAHGYWSAVAKLVLESLVPDDGVPILYERALQRFARTLTLSRHHGLIEYFGTPDGFEEALAMMSALGVVGRDGSGRLVIEKDLAVLFLTQESDMPLLKKLLLNC